MKVWCEGWRPKAAAAFYYSLRGSAQAMARVVFVGKKLFCRTASFYLEVSMGTSCLLAKDNPTKKSGVTFGRPEHHSKREAIFLLLQKPVCPDID